MSETRICGIVITFNPSALNVGALASLRIQLDDMVIVDNGSNVASLRLLRDKSVALPFRLVENRANLGVAAALNIGIATARHLGCSFVALFDQDSNVTEGFIQSLKLTFDTHPKRDVIATVMPRYKNRETGAISEPAYLACDGAPLEVMTSGSFHPISVFDRCGGFEEELFIDHVDHEFAFRVRMAGLIVVVSEDAYLIHTPGDPTSYSALGGRIAFRTSNHNAVRRYYITRNGIVMIRKFRAIHPIWSRNVAKALVALPLLVLLAESDKWKKLHYIAKGAIDAFAGRMGKSKSIHKTEGPS